MWPIVDKKQSRDFKTTCHSLLAKLEKDSNLPSGIVRLSHLHSASGERYASYGDTETSVRLDRIEGEEIFRES